MTNKTEIQNKKKAPESERVFTFEYGKNPPTMEERISFVRYIFEGKFKGFSLKIGFVLIFIFAFIYFVLYWWFAQK